MQIIKEALKDRQNRVVRISRYFLNCKCSSWTIENFARVIKHGRRLNSFLKTVNCVRELEESEKTEIMNYLIACEETIREAGIEVPYEFCDVQDVLVELRDQRLLLSRFLDGSLNESMF